MKKLALVCAVLAALLFGALPASAGTPVAFTGYGTGSISVSSTGHVTSTGPYTLTAPSSGTGTYSLSFTTGQPPACNVGTSTTSGTIELGSGSSTLTFALTGIICEDTDPNNSVDYYHSALLTVTGATGSYSGYTGSGSMGASSYGSTTQFTVSGTVTPP